MQATIPALPTSSQGPGGSILSGSRLDFFGPRLACDTLVSCLHPLYPLPLKHQQVVARVEFP